MLNCVLFYFRQNLRVGALLEFGYLLNLIKLYYDKLELMKTIVRIYLNRE